MEEAKDEGWRVVTVNGEDSDAIGDLELTIKLAFAQEERQKISERTKAGLRRAKREGRKLGRPSPIPRPVVERIVDLRMREGLSAKAIAA